MEDFREVDITKANYAEKMSDYQKAMRSGTPEFQLRDGLDRDDFIKAYAEAKPDDREGVQELIDYRRQLDGFQQRDGLDRDDFIANDPRLQEIYDKYLPLLGKSNRE